MNLDTAFIVTTHCAHIEHLECLNRCISALREHYHNYYVYILNDNSPLNIETPVIKKGIDEKSLAIYNTSCPHGGEINPYIFINSEGCKHDRLIYIHDSVVVKPGIEKYLDYQDDIIVLWYARWSVWDLVFDTHNNEILDKLTVNNRTVRSLLTQYQRSRQNFFVSFGSMSIFSKNFVQKLFSVSNFQETCTLFKSRTNRCLFERLLSLFIIEIYKDVPTKFVCGDIHRHPSAFFNKNPNVFTNTCATKVWCGR